MKAMAEKVVQDCLKGRFPLTATKARAGPLAKSWPPRFRKNCLKPLIPLPGYSWKTRPLSVRLEANPLVPGDTDASSLPIAQLRYVVTNTADSHVRFGLCDFAQLYQRPRFS